MPQARQLCRGSNTVSTSDATLRKCPQCGVKLTAVEWMPWTVEGRREKRPVVPPHIRDERAEVAARLHAERTRYPGVVS